MEVLFVSCFFLFLKVTHLKKKKERTNLHSQNASNNQLLYTGYSKRTCSNFFPYDIILIFNRKIKYIDFLSFVCIHLQIFLQKRTEHRRWHSQSLCHFFVCVKIGIIYTLSYTINNIYLFLYVRLFYPLGRICA